MLVASRAGDRAVLEELASGGDRPEIRRPVQVWLYGTTRELGAVCLRLEKLGWNVVSFVTDVRDQREWEAELVLSRSQAADEASIFAMSDEIEGAIAGTSAVYDGWETSVEPGDASQVDGEMRR